MVNHSIIQTPLRRYWWTPPSTCIEWPIRRHCPMTESYIFEAIVIARQALVIVPMLKLDLRANCRPSFDSVRPHPLTNPSTPLRMLSILSPSVPARPSIGLHWHPRRHRFAEVLALHLAHLMDRAAKLRSPDRHPTHRRHRWVLRSLLNRIYRPCLRQCYPSALELTADGPRVIVWTATTSSTMHLGRFHH